MNPARKTMQLIHHGANRFDRSKFRHPADSTWTKPRGQGFWASPVDSEWGWKDWCLSEEFALERLEEKFTFEITGLIITIDSVEDLSLLDWVHIPGKIITNLNGIRFSRMAMAGIDAIHLTVKGEDETRHSRPFNLYGWDCESVLILNESIIPDTPEVIRIPPEFVTHRRRFITKH